MSFTKIIETKCPICRERVKLKISKYELKNIKHYPFSHIYFHGKDISSMHAFVTYLDANLEIRGFEIIHSFQFTPGFLYSLPLFLQ